MAYSKIRQPKLSDVIEQQLEFLILEGTLRPGEKLPPERELIPYRTADDAVRVEVLYESETFWLDQRRTEGLEPLGGLWGMAFRLSGMRETVAYFQAEAEAALTAAHMAISNVVIDGVPAGGEDDYVVLDVVGEPTRLPDPKRFKAGVIPDRKSVV